jgi:RNA polymerase sigma-19 factor, ECF subfamily
MSEPRKRRDQIGGVQNFGASLVQRYAQAVRRYFDRRLTRIQDTEDLAQEVYLRLLRIDSGAKVQKPLQFVYGMARHVLLDHRAEAAEQYEFLNSGRDSSNGIESPLEDPAQRPEDQVEVEQQLEEIFQLLPPLFAAVLLLHDRDGMSYEEVAIKLGISVHTVKKYLTEARARIRMLSWNY